MIKMFFLMIKNDKTSMFPYSSTSPELCMCVIDGMKGICWRKVFSNDS